MSIKLAEVNLPLAGQCAANLAPRINRFVPLAERLLARMRDPHSDLRARIAAGKALGEMEALEVLGYQSLNDSSGRRIAWLPPTEPIPGGEYRFGSRDDPDADDDEQPFSQIWNPSNSAAIRLPMRSGPVSSEPGGYNKAEFWQGQVAQDYRLQGSAQADIQFWLLIARRL